MMNYYGWDHMGYPGAFGFGFVFNIIFWIVAVVLIVGLIKWIVGGKRRHWHDEDDDEEAMKVLKMRYAKGEINKKEYESMKDDIS